MIDTDSLRTASTYINNQLLSRGLLRDGQTVDFAEPSQDGDTSATMGRIISVVNDLILRRDRDAEHRESLSVSMRGLKADSLKATNDFSKLSEKYTEAQRKLNIAESTESALKTQLKSAETAIKGLKEDMARTKALVAQTRALCATDVRRRDRQIDTMKKQLGEAARARGSSRTPGITSIIVSPNVRADASTASATGTTSTDDEAYSLRSETNAFLANLAQSLSEENETVVNLMRKTMGQLRTMSSFSPTTESDPEVIVEPSVEELTAGLESVMVHMRTILTNPSFVPVEEVMVREEEINRLKDGWVKMEDRWKDAVHLIDGWRKRMATNGKPIGEDEFQLGLRLSPVRVKGVKETRSAIVGKSLAAVAEEEAEGDSGEEAMPPGSLGLSDEMADDPEPEAFYEGHEPERHVSYSAKLGAAKRPVEVGAPLRESKEASPPLPEPPKLSPLKNSATAGNRGSTHHEAAGSKLASLRAKREEKRAEVGPLRKPATRPARSLPVPSKPLMQRSQPRTASGTVAGRPKSPVVSSLDDVSATKEARMEVNEKHLEAEELVDEAGPDEHYKHSHEKPVELASDLSEPEEEVEPEQQSPLAMKNIAVKLAAAEREADAARVRAKLRAARGTGGVKRPTPAKPRTVPQKMPPESAPMEDELARNDPVEDMDPVKRDVGQLSEEPAKTEKRKRDRKSMLKSSSRRRSTLSPWELETLISGSAQ